MEQSKTTSGLKTNSENSNPQKLFRRKQIDELFSSSSNMSILLVGTLRNIVTVPIFWAFVMKVNLK